MKRQPTLHYIHFLLKSLSPIIERERRRVDSQNRRTAKRGQPATLTLRQWLSILHVYEWRCAFCKGPVESMEHLTRVADGGGTEATNVVPCCLTCNQDRGRMVQQTHQARHKVEALV